MPRAVKAEVVAPVQPGLMRFDLLLLRLGELLVKRYVHPGAWDRGLGPVVAAKFEELGVAKPMDPVSFARGLGLLKPKKRQRRIAR